MIPPVLGIFFFTIVATRWLMRSGNLLVVAAEPNHRSLHKKSTPNGGGLSIIAALFLMEAWQRLHGDVLFPSLLALLGFTVIAIVSFLDDRHPVPSGVRFLVHLGAAGLLALSGLQLDYLPFPGLLEQPLELGWLALPITLVAVVWFTNLYNFMDGMDGFCSGMTAFGFGGCSLLAWSNGDSSLALLCASASAAGAGFLIWNFPPASIFMGDVSAAPLGFLVAVVTFLGVKNQSLELWQPLLIFAPFWVDATATLIRRLVKKERFWEAHCSHAYQRFARAGWGHRQTTIAEYALMGIMIFAAWIFGEIDSAGQFVVLLGSCVLFLVAWLLLRAVEKSHLPRSGE